MELRDLSDRVKALKTMFRDVFEKYQASGMGTLKWPFIDYLILYLKVNGDKEYIDR